MTGASASRIFARRRHTGVVAVLVRKTAGTSVTARIEPALRWIDLVLGGTAFGEGPADFRALRVRSRL